MARTEGFMKSSHNQVFRVKKRDFFVWPDPSFLTHEYICLEVNGDSS